MHDPLTLKDIAYDLRVSGRTVQRLVKNGVLSAMSRTRRGGHYFIVPLQIYLDWKRNWLRTKQVSKQLAGIAFLKTEQEKWLEWCSNGNLTGKPMSENTALKNRFSINYYWNRLPHRNGKSPLISVKYLRFILGNIDVKKFGLKDNIFKAIISFTKYLIANNFCSETLLTELRKLKPKRFYPPKKVHCTAKDFEKLLSEAGKRFNGQSDYDAILNKTIIATLGFSGLRNAELCNLRIQDIDLINRSLYVYLGKGKKNRTVGICQRLYEHLAEYLNIRPSCEIENFFVTAYRKTGTAVPFNRLTLNRKIKRLTSRVGIETNIHGLRRSFATIAANAGKPINIISLALGHSNLTTTQGYLMTSESEVIKEMQGW